MHSHILKKQQNKRVISTIFSEINYIFLQSVWNTPINLHFCNVFATMHITCPVSNELFTLTSLKMFHLIPLLWNHIFTWWEASGVAYGDPKYLIFL